jgi:hypothetical protein
MSPSSIGCTRVRTVPGIGPIISSAMVAAIRSFGRERSFAPFRIDVRLSSLLFELPKDMLNPHHFMAARVLEMLS